MILDLEEIHVLIKRVRTEFIMNSQEEQSNNNWKDKGIGKKSKTNPEAKK